MRKSSIFIILVVLTIIATWAAAYFAIGTTGDYTAPAETDEPIHNMIEEEPAIQNPLPDATISEVIDIPDEQYLALNPTKVANEHRHNMYYEGSINADICIDCGEQCYHTGECYIIYYPGEYTHDRVVYCSLCDAEINRDHVAHQLQGTMGVYQCFECLYTRYLDEALNK